MKTYLCVAFTLHACTFQCALGDAGFLRIDQPVDVIRHLSTANGRDVGFFRAALLPLDQVSGAPGVSRSCRFFFLNNWNSGRIITISEEIADDGKTRFRIWHDVINSKKSILLRSARFSDNPQLDIFFKEIFSGKGFAESFFKEEFWVDVDVGGIDPGRLIFEKLEEESYSCVSVIPPITGERSDMLQDFLFRLLDLLKGAGVDTAMVLEN